MVMRRSSYYADHATMGATPEELIAWLTDHYVPVPDQRPGEAEEDYAFRLAVLKADAISKQQIPPSNRIDLTTVAIVAVIGYALSHFLDTL